MLRLSREKTALGIFALLLAGALCGIGWYIVAGHSWNTTASHVDEAVGSMEGYTTIIFENTLSKDSISVREELCDTYKDKGAEVVLLDLKTLDNYRDGSVVQTDFHTVGMLNFDSADSKSDISKAVKSFASQDVDLIVALVPQAKLMQDMRGVDAVVLTQEGNMRAGSKTKKGVLYINASDQNKLGVMVISPSNAVSARAVEDY